MSKYAAVNVKFGADISSFSTAMQNAAREMKKAGDQLQNVGRSMTMNLTAPIVALGAAALYSFGQIDALKRGLISFAGSAQLAEDEFNKLREVAKLPGIGLEEAVKGSINLQAIGMGADEARKAMMAFGNAIATVGGGKENFDLAIRGFGQLTNASKPLQQDLYQIANQLPQVNKLMIDAFGTNRAEDLAKMGISGKQLADFLVTELGKLPKVSGGIKDSFENMSDSVKISLASFGEAIEKNFNISGKIKALSNWLARLVEDFSNLNPFVQKTILVVVGLVAALGPLLLVIGGIVTIMPTVLAGIAAISTAFGILTGVTLAAVWPFVVITGAIAGVVAVGMYMYDNWKVISKFFINLFSGMANIVLTIVKGLVSGISTLFSYLGVDMSGAEKAIDKLIDGLPKKQDIGEFKGFAESLSNVMDSVKKSLFIDKNGKAKIEVPQIVPPKTPPKGDGEPSAEGYKLHNFEPLNMDSKQIGNQLTEVASTVREATPDVESAFKDLGDRANWALTEASKEMQRGISSMNQIIANGVMDMTVSLLSAFGENLVDGDPFKDLGNVLLGSLGNLMVQLGTEMLIFGGFMKLFQEAIKTLQPEVAIVAGIGMIVAGAAISKIAANGMKGGSGATSGGGYGGSSGGSGSSGNLTLTTRVDGRDLVFAGDNTTRVQRR